MKTAGDIKKASLYLDSYWKYVKCGEILKEFSKHGNTSGVAVLTKP
jgi:hypothetical protein